MGFDPQFKGWYGMFFTCKKIITDNTIYNMTKQYKLVQLYRRPRQAIRAISCRGRVFVAFVFALSLSFGMKSNILVQLRFDTYIFSVFNINLLLSWLSIQINV